MISNVFSIVDVLRAERKDGRGDRGVRIYATRYFKEGYHGVFDKTSLIRLCDYLVSPLVASLEFLIDCCPYSGQRNSV